MEHRWYHLFRKKYLGNIKSKKVHDLEHEDKGEEGCQIGEILIKHIKLFEPDTEKQAEKEGFERCDKCRIVLEIEN